MFYKQTTYESCLAVCLMHLINVQPNAEKELAIWQKGWTSNYLIRQLNYVSKEYEVNFKVYVGNKYYYDSLIPLVETEYCIIAG